MLCFSLLFIEFNSWAEDEPPPNDPKSLDADGPVVEKAAASFAFERLSLEKPLLPAVA